MMSLLAQTPVQGPAVEWFYLAPIVIMALGGILLITITSIAPALRGKQIPAILTVGVGVAALAFVPFIAGRLNDLESGQVELVGSALVVDHFTLWITSLICLATILVAVVLDGYVRREGLDAPEWYALLMISASGGIILASAQDLIVAFLGLEILSIAVYVLASLHVRRTESQEAGFKYFILGALASAIFLYGIALVYGATGSTNIDGIAGSMNSINPAGLSPAVDASMVMLGMALLLVGFGFKVSAFPLHIWTPDVYQGSPTPVVGFMASAVKVAAFGGMMRVFLVAFGGTFAEDWRVLVMCMAAFTVIFGSFLAIVQTNIKRTMAFSSIAHAGFMLVGLFAAADHVVGDTGKRALLFYLLAYTIMSIGTFAVLSIVGGKGDGNHSIEAFQGLGKREPLLAAGFAVLLFGQVGAPFTAGFFAKFRVIAAAAEVGSTVAYVLAAVAMLASAVGVFLYLRIVVAMFLDGDHHASEELADTDAEVESAEPALEVPGATLAVVLVTAAATIVLGVFPDLGAGSLAEAAAALVR